MKTYPLFKAGAEAGNTWFQGYAGAEGAAEAGVSFSRGVDLSAGVDLQAGLGADLARGIQAHLKAGARLTGGVSLQAALPLDLFREAGFVGRMRAQAAAGAYVRVHLGLQSDELANLVRGMLEAPWGELARIFLSELEVGAELMGNAQVSAQLVAEAIISGSLIAQDKKPAGFTCSFQYAMGYYYGAGFSFKVRYGLQQPARLLERLGNQLAAIVEREIGALPAAERPAAELVRPLVRFVIPLVLRLLYEQGVRLASAEPKQQAAQSSLAQVVIRESQELMAGMLFDLAIAQARQILDDPTLTRLDALAGDARESATEALLRLRSTIAQLDRPDLAPADWVVGAGQLILALAELTVLVPAASRDAWDEALTLAWASAVVLERLLRWSSDGHNRQILDPTAAVVIQPTARIVARVAAQIGRPDAAVLTVGSAVAYLVERQAVLVQELLADTAVAGPALDLLVAVINPGGTETILTALYKTLASAEGTTADDVMGRLTAALSPALERVMQAALDPLIRSSGGYLRELLSEVLRPALLVTARHILPNAASVTDETKATLVREQISSVLLRVFAGFLLKTSRVLADYAVADGPGALGRLTDELRAGVGGEELDSGLFWLSPAVGIPLELAPSRSDLIRILDLSAETLVRWGDPALDHRGKWFAAADELVRLGFSIGDAEMEQLWNELAATDLSKAPPTVLQRLERAALLLKDSLWDLAQFLAPRLAELLALHFAELPSRVFEAMKYGVEGAVEAARTVARVIESRLQDLDRIIADLRDALRRAADHIVTTMRDLSRRLAELEARAPGIVREAGWSVVRQSLNFDPVFIVLPEAAKQVVVSGVRAVYDTVFTVSSLPLIEPLRMFRLAETWLAEGLELAVQGQNLSDQAVLDHMRRQAERLFAPDLALPVSFTLPGMPLPFGGTIASTTINLGVITLPGNQIARWLVNFLLNDATLAQLVGGIVETKREMVRQSTELTLLEKHKESLLSEGDIATAIAGLTTGLPLGLEILEPAGGQIIGASGLLRVVLRGANRSYLSGVLGVPARVKVLVNGAEHRFAPESWRDQGGELLYEANLLPPSADLVPLPVLPTLRVLEVELGGGSQLTPIVARGRRPAFTLEPSALATAIAPAPVGPQLTPVIPVFPGTPGLTPATPQPARPMTARAALLGTPIFDPLTGGLVVAEPAQPTPVVLQPVGGFAPSAAEQVAGVRWVPPGDVLGGVVDPAAVRETIAVREGVNWIEVVVVNGVDGQALAVARHVLVERGAQP